MGRCCDGAVGGALLVWRGWRGAHGADSYFTNEPTNYSTAVWVPAMTASQPRMAARPG